MGITFAEVQVSNPRKRRTKPLELDFLIDTGAIYSVMPASLLRRLGVERMDREEFTLADGTKHSYDVGEAFFQLGARGATSKVIFAPEGATALLGAITLESLGLMVNPITRELTPMRLILAAARRKDDAQARRSRKSTLPPKIAAAAAAPGCSPCAA